MVEKSRNKRLNTLKFCTIRVFVVEFLQPWHYHDSLLTYLISLPRATSDVLKSLRIYLELRRFMERCKKIAIRATAMFDRLVALR